MTVRQELTNFWQPRELVLQALRQPLEPFVSSVGGRFLLLVMLDELNSELATGLLAVEASRSGEGDGLAFRTVVRDLDATLLGESAHAGPKTPTGRSYTALTPAASERPADIVPSDLLRKPVHVLPIQKRAEGSFLQHVSVGRARNHDIVLRHRSVSKFHAWFELPDNGRLLVKDSESRNHTFVDGQQITSRVEVHPGQTVRFGSVECRVCTPNSLWKALHA